MFCGSSSSTFKDNSVRQEINKAGNWRKVTTAWQKVKKIYQGLHYLVSKSREKDMAQ